jgi:hypothetical protein
MGDPQKDQVLAAADEYLKRHSGPKTVPPEEVKVKEAIKNYEAKHRSPEEENLIRSMPIASMLADYTAIKAGDQATRAPADIPNSSQRHGSISFGPSGTTTKPDSIPPTILPDDAATSKFARDISNETLRLPQDIIHGADLDNRAWDIHKRLIERTPRIAASIRAVEEQTGRKIAAPMNRLLAQIELTELTPQEIIPVAKLALKDFTQALGAGKLARGLGPREFRAEAIQENPSLAQETIAKLISVEDPDEAEDLLRVDGPFGNEKAMARDLSGFTRYFRQKEGYYRGRHRLSQVLGHDLPQNFGDGSLFETVPDNSNFDLNHLGERIPWLQELQRAATDRAVTQAQFDAIEQDAIANLGPATQIGIDLYDKGGLLGLGVEAGMTALHWIDQGSFGLIGQLIKDADEVLGAGGYYQGIKGNLVKGLLTGPDAKDLETRYNYMLSAYPDMDPDKVREETGQLFSTSVLVGELPRMVQAITGVDLATLAGTGEEGVANVFKQLGGFFDSPTIALMTLGAIPKVAKEVKGARARHLERIENGVFDGIKGLKLQDIVHESRGSLMRQILDGMSRAPKNAGMARNLLNRFVGEMNIRGWALGPELFGKLRVAMNSLEQGAKGLLKNRVTPTYRNALKEAGQAFTPDSIFRSARVKPTGARQTLVPNSLEVADTAINYMTRAGLRDAVLENLPPTLKGPAGTTLEKAANSFIADNARRNTAKGNHVLARDVLKTVFDDLKETTDALVNETTSLLEKRNGKVDLYNQQIRRAINRAHSMERDGGKIAEARRIVRSKEYADAVVAMENGKFAAQWLFSEGKLNRRLATKIGGSELVKEVNHLLSERKIAAQTGHTNLVDKMLRETIQSYAKEFVREASIPEWRGISPNPKPRTRAFAKMLKAFDELKEGEVAKLSDAELAVLNEFQPRGAPLTRDFLRDLSDFDKGLKSASSRLKSLGDLRTKVGDYYKKVVETPPGDVLGFKLDKRIHAMVSKYMDEPLSEILYGDAKKGGGFTLSRPQQMQSWRKVWDSLVEKVPEERRLLERQLIKLTSFEMSALPAHIQIGHALEEAQHARNGMNWVQLESAQILHEMEAKLNHKQRLLLREAIITGKTPKGLPAEAADYLASRMWKQRVEQLQADLLAGKIPIEKYAEWAKRDYLPELYEKDPVLADGVARVTEPSFRNTDIDKMIQPNNAGYRARTRTDTWDVSYKLEGKDHLQKGFKNEFDAREWARRNLNDTTKFEIREPYPEDLKVADGLQQDPGISHAKRMETMALDRGLFMIQRVMSTTDLVKLEPKMVETLRSRGLDPAVELREGRIAIDFNDQFGSRKYFKIRNQNLPDLNGKWVREDVMDALAEVTQGYQIFESLTSGIKEAAAEAHGKLYHGFWKGTGEAVAATNHMLATTHVPMSLLSYARGWMSNIGYAQLADFNLWNPINQARFAGYMADMVKDLAPAAGKALRHLDVERLFLKTKTGTYISDLLKDNQIHAGEPVFNAEMARAVKKFHNGTGALKTRIEDINGRLRKYFDDEGQIKNPADVPIVQALMEKASKLDAQLDKATKNSLKDFTKEWLVAARDNGLRGRGEGVRKIWAAYLFGSGDTPMKIATYRYLRDVQGMSKEGALSRCRDFFQQMHSPGNILKARIPGLERGLPAENINKLLGRSLGGSMFMGFKTEQLRIWDNALRAGHRGRLMKYLSLMAGWNYLHVLGSGESMDEYGAAFAQRHKLRPGPMSNILSLLQGIRLKGRDDNGVDMIGMDNLYGAFFLEPFTPFGKGIEKVAAGDEDSGLAQKAAGGILGAMVESSAMGSAILGLVQTVTQGGTAFGTPLRPDTVGQILRETFLPPMLGGYEWNRMTRVAGGNDISPQTYEGQGFWDFAKSRVFGIRKLYGTPQRLQAAYHNVMAFQNKDNPRGGNHVTDELFEERKHSITAHNAVDPITGEVDPEKNRAAMTELLRSRQKYLVAPSGEIVAKGVDQKALDRALEATALPKILYNINRESLVTMMQVYGLWRRADPYPKGEWANRLHALIGSKINNGSVPDEQIRDAITYARDMIDVPGMPADAQHSIKGWSAALTKSLFEKKRR